MKSARSLWYIALFLGALLQSSCGETIDSRPVDTSSDKGDSDTDTDTDAGTDADAGTLTGDCKDVGVGSGMFEVQYASDVIHVEGSDKTYILQTNWWGLSNGQPAYDGQTVSYDGLSFTVGNPNNVDMGASGSPAGYPSLFIGSYSGKQSIGSNLPIRVSDIESVPTSFHTNSMDDGLSNKNAAYDVWLTAGGEPLPPTQYSPGQGGYYLMVWLFMPEDRQPRGNNDHPDHTVKGVSGTWDVWIDGNSVPCISYVRTEPLDSLDFDLNAFIQDSVDNDYGVTEDMYLSIIFAGFELWGQGDGLTVDRFCAEVN